MFFNSQATWEVLRPRQPSQPWHDEVWFKGAVPKHAFTMWVANDDRLPTRSRLASWGLAVPLTCPFCCALPETRDHIFLSCQYSYDVWSLVFARCSPHRRRSLIGRSFYHGSDQELLGGRYFLGNLPLKQLSSTCENRETT